MRRFALQRRLSRVGLMVVAIALLATNGCLAQLSSLAADIGPVEDALFYEENTSLPPALESNQCAAGKDLRKGVAPRIPGIAMVACPTMRFNCEGHLVRWRMLSIKDNGMAAHLIVWRPTGEAGVHTFVGKVSRQMNQKGYIEIVITDPEEQISVKPGDFIGVAYDPRSYGGVVPWATHGYTDPERDNCVTVAVFGQDLDVPGKIFSLGETYVDRILMLQAIVEVNSDNGYMPPPRVTYAPANKLSTYGDSSQEYAASSMDSIRAPPGATCTTGVQIQAEPISRIPGNFLNVCPTMKISCDGQLYRWDFFSALEDGTPAYLAVFRPADPNGGTKYFLVGMTRVVATHFGPASYDIPASERFYVQTGDVLGVLYDSATSIGVVPFVDERVLDGYQISDLQVCVKKRIFVEDVRSSTAALEFGDTQTRRLILVRAHVQGGHSRSALTANQRSSSHSARHALPPSQLAEMAMAMAPVQASGDTCQVGPHLSTRVPSRRPGVWLNVCPNVMAPCAGRIRRWQIMSAADDSTATYLSVWRQVSEGKRKYRLIGYNKISADSLGLKSYDVEEAERISVQAGDLIGVMYDSSARAGSVGFADNDDPEGFAAEDFTNCFRARISKQDADSNPVQDFGETMQQRLVLMSATIESAAADVCPPPPVVQNARVLKIVEQTITYACQAGYVMEDERSTVTCREGAWTRSPRCVKMSCSDVPSVENGRIGDGSSEVGASRSIVCNDGFRLIGDVSSITCLKSGQWSQPTRCAAVTRSTAESVSKRGSTVTASPESASSAAASVASSAPSSASNRCGQPPELAGGRLSGGSGGQQYGDTRQYKCDAGFVMTGNSVIVCLDSGQWTRPPVCNPIQPTEHPAPVDCGEPQSVDHAVLRGQGTKEGTERWYDCEAGYVMQNFPRIVCQSDGQWSTPPSCLPLVCPHPPQVNMATRQFSSRLFNSVATYKCTKPDCVMLGSAELRCSESGQWQPKPPTCLCGNEQEAEEGNICPDPPIVSNGFWVVNKLPTGDPSASTNRSVGTVLEMRCGDCYERAGSSTPFIRCGRQLLWTTTSLYCKIVECSSDSLPTIEHGTISDGLATCNSSRAIICDSGYVRSGGSSVVCQSDSYWSSPAPRCVFGGSSSSGSCGTVPMISNGKIDEGGFFVGARRSVTCDSGFRIDTGPFVVFCQSDGTWSRPPNCTQAGCQAPAANVGVQYTFNRDSASGEVYPVGTKANFDCKYGYKLLVPATLVCNDDGIWDGAQGLCQRIRCYNLPQVSRGYYRPSADEPYYVDTSANLICSPGLKAYNATSIKCDKSGNWEQPGICVAADYRCTALPQVVNGKYRVISIRQLSRRALGDGDAITPGTIAKLECAGGFFPSEPVVITCSEKGAWLPAPFGRCTKSTCSAVPTVENGRFVFTDRAYPGTIAQLQCESGFSVSGDAGISCLLDGTWTRPQGRCVSAMKIECTSNPSLDNGQVVVRDRSPGSTARVSCNSGYDLVGDSNGATCSSDGTWSVTSYCRKRAEEVTCRAEPRVDNGRVSVNGRKVGATGRISCNSGFELVGDEEDVICSSDGTWAISSYCRQTENQVTCDSDPEVEHGRVSFRGRSVGSTGQVVCDSGYVLNGPSDAVSCMSNGVWDISAYCQKAGCQYDKPYIENGEVVVRDSFVGDLGTIVCNDGYELRGLSRVVCESNGKWRNYGTCIESHPQCSSEALPEIANAKLIETGVSTRWIVACFDGYVWDGATQFLSCLNNGTWSAPGRCLPINCGDPDETVNGAFELTGTRLGSIAVLKCEPGYTVMGNAIIQCLASGKWTQSGTCIKITCEDLPFVTNGRYVLAQSGVMSMPVFARLICNPGYVVQGNDLLRCQMDGSWSQQGGECASSFIECGEEPSIDNGFVQSGSSEVGSQRTIQCNFGYTLQGPGSITCKADSKWSNAGTCQRVLEKYRCGPPPRVRNARVLPTSRTDRGNSWRIVCNPGFALSDRKQWALVLCSKEGRWDPNPPMQCEEPVTDAPRCPDLSVDNAIIAGSDSGVGAARQIICIPGYDTPVRSVTCQANGMWSPSPPNACSPKDCGVPKAIANGQVLPGGTRFGDARYITCDIGYALNGAKNITCTLNGATAAWSEYPSCSLAESPIAGQGPVARAGTNCDIGDLPQITNGVWSAQQAGRRVIEQGSIVRATCVSPCYKLSGPAAAICLGDGSWNVTSAPTCTAQQCGAIPTVDFSYTSPPVVSKNCGSKFRYICQTGYFQVGPQEAECGADGMWSFTGSNGAQTLCLRNVTERCSALVPEIVGASINVGTDSVGSQRLVTCLPGYTMSPPQTGSVYLVCGPNYRWVTPNITCVLSGCSALPNLEQSVEFDVSTPPVGPYSSGSSVQVHCANDRNRELNGSNTVTCQTGTTWSQGPTCPAIVGSENCRIGKSVPVTALAQMNRAFIACPNLAAACGGDADSWVFYSLLNDGSQVGLRVYRPLGVVYNQDLKQNDTQYALVNETIWVANKVGRIVLPISKSFRVMPDDFIGIHYPSSSTGSKSVIAHADMTKLGTFEANDLVDCYYKPLTDGMLHDAVPQFMSNEEQSNFTWYGRDRLTMLPSLQLIVRKPGYCGEPTIENGKSDYLSTLDQPGYVVLFKCREEYEIVGARRATCGADGVWSQLPSCEVHESIPCTAGRREALASNQNRLVLPRQLYVFPDFKFNCSSRITEWHFWADAPFGNNTVVFLSMWRSFRGRLYYLVGSNRVPVTNRGLNIYKIPESEQFEVDADSFLGIHFASGDGPKFISYFDELHPGTLVPHQFSVFTSKGINEAELQEDMAKFGYLSLDPVDVQNRIAPAIFARGFSLAGCGLPPPTPYGRYQLSDGTRLDSRAEYTCVSGTKPADAISSSVCQDDKTWSTPRPVCIKDDICRSGRNASRLPMVFSTSFLNIYTNYTFDCAGVVTRWTFFSRNYSAVIYLGVWRKERGLLNSYRLVGYTKVSTSKVGWTSYDVDDDQVIPVLKGDVIGVHYKETKLPQRDVGIGFATPLSSPREPKESFSFGFAQDTSHDEIMRSGGLVQFTGPHFSNWRMPSVMAFVQTTTLSCGRLPFVPHARVSGSGPGQFQYQCDTNYVLVGESDTVTCQPNGRWTDPPVCKPSDDCDWNNLQDNNNKWEKYSGRSGNLKIFTSLPIGCQGWIKRWEFYSTQPAGQTVHLAVWRKLASGMMIQVKKNTLVTTGVGAQMHPIPADSQIQVMPGDYIGIHYNSFEDRIIPLGRPEDNIAEDLILDGYDEHLTESDLGSNGARSMSQQKRAIGAPALRAYIINQQDKVYQPCIEDTRCPLQSICTFRPCQDRVCVCKPGFWPNSDRTACVRSLVLGQACGNPESVCSIFGSYCDPQKQVCTCMPDFEPTDTVVPARCRPVSPVVKRQALLGEHCDNSTNVCYDMYQSVVCNAITSMCTCVDSYRPATEDEVTARPDELRQCLPVDYKLNSTYCPLVPQFQRAERGISYVSGDASAPSSSSSSLVLPAVLALLAAICIGGVLCVAVVLVRRNRQRRSKYNDLFATLSSSSVLSTRGDTLMLQRAASMQHEQQQHAASETSFASQTLELSSSSSLSSTSPSSTSFSSQSPTNSRRTHPRLSTITS